MNESPIAIVPAPRARKPLPKGRAVSPEALAWVQTWWPQPPARDRLIEALHRLQDHFGVIPLDHLAALAQWMRLPQAEVYEVASFYHHFHLHRGPPPAAPVLRIRVCNGLPCEMAGSAGLVRELAARLQRQAGPGAPAVEVLEAPCIGRCDQAPAVHVHQHPVPRATVASVLEAVDQGRRDEVVRPRQSLPAYLADGGLQVLRDCLAARRTREELTDTVRQAGLRGLGGAGFPAARKWQAVCAQPGPRLMAVNADEGEPGTFKDRWVLEDSPFQFLEGLHLAAWVVEAREVTVYLRDEYHGLRAMLAEATSQLQAWATAEGLVLPPVEWRRGAGAYICGEESAMLESIEGRRGLPRLRPPYVAQVGLFGLPTLVHNVETLHWLPPLLGGSAEAFAAQGRHGRRGLRRFCVSGRVAQPGVKLAPAGITLRELIDEHCGGMASGHELKAYLPGGASGGLLPASMADLPLDFDTLQPHGAFIGSAAVIVLSQADSPVDAARNTMAFFEHESCGQCTPCRAGTHKALALMQAPAWDRAALAELSQVMRDASICGLGQAAPNVLDGVLTHFGDEVPR